ncbi:ATP-binding protein [Geotalea sp. SG265]|uniref:sensor histidine kinase n=1 Tax=Geotalea sp. SG265 TaxID=2922867 RepID=UPI001FAE7907|nr:ATP-binding protein [Geotalea sp. SG265]
MKGDPAMSPEQKRLIKITTSIAATVALAIVVALPVVYYMTSYRYMQGALETEAEINARNVAAIIRSNPDLWRHETLRLEELLKRRPRGGNAEIRRIYDKNGELLVESADQLHRPIISKSYPLKDTDVAVGKIEISRSLAPLLRRVVLVTSVGMVLGAAVFISLIMLPRRALYELKEADERLQRFAQNLQETNEELKSFAYIISHDLKAPLVNIKGFAGELQMCLQELETILEKEPERSRGDDGKRIDEILEADVPEAIGFINSSVSRMDNLIGLILKLSRLGHRELKPEPVDLNDLVEGILKSMAHQLEQKCAQVSVAKLPQLVQDRAALEQIFGNLLDNAVKYLDSERPGRLEIWFEERHEEHIFNIRDNGRGISPDDQVKVFEIFRRAGKEDVPGEGMGLAYVKALIRRLGGQIWCVSECGVGSTFSFSLPSTEDGW